MLKVKYISARARFSEARARRALLGSTRLAPDYSRKHDLIGAGIPTPLFHLNLNTIVFTPNLNSKIYRAEPTGVQLLEYRDVG